MLFGAVCDSIETVLYFRATIPFINVKITPWQIQRYNAQTAEPI